MQTSARVKLHVEYDYARLEWRVIPLVSSPATPTKRLERQARRIIRLGPGAAQAKASFPNSLGNYRGKRTPRPSPPAKTPRELFNSLAAHYLSCRQTYRNGPFADPNWQANYQPKRRSAKANAA